ncbi:UNVERIFIED_CONTAM: hypothetical protein GTU68_057942 [Idotea baltica]|nr:hypothetical protein [Idotea baltica]
MTHPPYSIMARCLTKRAARFSKPSRFAQPKTISS